MGGMTLWVITEPVSKRFFDLSTSNAFMSPHPGFLTGRRCALLGALAYTFARTGIRLGNGFFCNSNQRKRRKGEPRRRCSGFSPPRPVRTDAADMLSGYKATDKLNLSSTNNQKLSFHKISGGRYHGKPRTDSPPSTRTRTVLAVPWRHNSF